MMLDKIYLETLSRHLKESNVLTVEMLVWLIQSYRTIQIEKLSKYLPMPIKFESRRKKVKRILALDELTLESVWLPIIKQLIDKWAKNRKQLFLAIDRTQWKNRNILMVSVIIGKRAFPIYWTLLDKKGNSSLEEQTNVLKPVLELLKDYDLIVLGDREFHSAKLAEYFLGEEVGFVLRQKKNTNISTEDKDFYQIGDLQPKPGTREFHPDIIFTKTHKLKRTSLGVYWKRKYRDMGEKEPWFLLTNLPSLQDAIRAFRKRTGIEAMFKDCKTGGYNLEGSHASDKRLHSLLLLMAIAYTHSTFNGFSIRLAGQAEYIGRHRKIHGKYTPNSHFYLGLFASTWILDFSFLQDFIARLFALHPNKHSFYNRGLKAMSITQSAF